MGKSLAELTDQQLLDELERVERAIVRSTTFHRRINSAGQAQVSVSQELLTLAEREHAAVEELRRRRRSLSAA